MHKPSKLLSLLWDFAKRFGKSLWREASISWQFIKRDIWATIIPAVLFMVAAWRSHPSNTSELLLVLGRGLLFFGLYIFSFCLANQIVGIQEDQINKPDRPLVTGAVLYQGALVRYAVSTVAFFLVGVWFGVWQWTLLWIACTVLHNFCGLAKYWVSKNLIMGIGTLAQLASAWQMVAPITPVAERWIVLISVVVGLLIPLQDLRDIDGDRAIGRNTFPIAFGETVTRLMLCVGFGLLPLVNHFGLMMHEGNTLDVILCDIILAVVSWSIAVRIILYRSPQSDHHTYMGFNYLYTLVLASAIIIVL